MLYVKYANGTCVYSQGRMACSLMRCYMTVHLLPGVNKAVETNERGNTTTRHRDSLSQLEVYEYLEYRLKPMLTHLQQRLKHLDPI